MRGLTLPLSLVLGLALAAAVASANPAGGGTRAAPGEPAPVASLEPARTEALWSRLVATGPRRTAQTGTCRPLRAVFYAATDWLRLATKLAAQPSTCAEYYVYVPAIVGNRTRMRPNAASRIRELGSNFHALAEIHFTAWSRWVAETGSSWHTAGVTARQRMAEAGYDVTRGDTWALNELTSAVRRGEGNARANIREFLRGLYEGDGSRPTRGTVLVIGVGQRTSDLSVYQNTLQNWLADSAFWTDMATYVSDWSQEVYGDVRSHAVPGVSTTERREYLNDYLNHKLVLASAGPEAIATARSYLQEAYSPLANAAWRRDAAYGWTDVPVDMMASYLSAQVNAMRFFSAQTGQPRDHWGFAWAPRNASGLPADEFAAQSGALLDRLAAAIRDSGNVVDPENPGSGACGPPGRDVWCVGDLPEARHNGAWRSFRGWTQPVLDFVDPLPSITAGTSSPSLRIALVTTTGAPIAVGASVVIRLRSSSPRGAFSTSPAGPWTNTLSLAVSAGSEATFHYLDTRAGSATLTASGPGVTTGTQAVTVAAGPVARIAVTPASGSVQARGQRRFTAAGADVYGNAVSSGFTWAVTPAALGTIVPGRNGTATFTAERLTRTGTITAAADGIVGTAAVTVTPARLRIGSLSFRSGSRRLLITLTTIDRARRPVSNTRVSIAVRRNGARHFVGRARTGAAGRVRFRAPVADGCFVVRVTGVSATGFTWDGRSPRNRFCR